MSRCIYITRKRKHSYVMLDKEFLQDVSMTMQAKGLLTYLLSLPDDWKINRKELVTRFKNGERALTRTLKELETWIREKIMRKLCSDLISRCL